ncbi:MAG: hypothetical protein WBC22_19640 [Sedimentisphaerales bacterium]
MRKWIALVILSFLHIHSNVVWSGDEILLKSRRFTPAKGISDTVKVKIEAIPERAHVLIQLEKIPTIRERKELEAKGIKLLSYIPNNAWFASIPSDKSDEIAALYNVRSICEILPDDKISPTIRGGVDTININADGTVNLAVVFFGDISLADAAKNVSNYGGVVYGKTALVNALLIKISNHKILDLQNEDIVKWITGASILPQKCNDDSRAAIHVEEIQDTPYNLTGTGVIAGEWDGGWIDTTHHDLAGRVTIGDASYCGTGLYPDTGSCSTDYHATHVAGTVGAVGVKLAALCFVGQKLLVKRIYF